MIHIHPVSDLRNKFPEIESLAQAGQPVFLTKNGHGSLVVLSLESFSRLTDDIDLKLDEADRAAAESDYRLTHDDVFGRLRGLL
jgi:prevent-host-death family protein